MKRTVAMLFLMPLALVVGCEDRNNNTTTTAPSTNSNSTSTTPHTSTTPQTLPAPERSPSNVNPPPAPDNTGRNERDRDGGTLTPENQSESEADRKITADVRSSITSDTTMSVNARNIKIITQNGVVTLRGPVETQDEKDDIEAKARAVAGVVRIDNQLEVKAGAPADTTPPAPSNPSSPSSPSSPSGPSSPR